LLASLQTLPAQRQFALTIDNIMRGPGLVGYEPSAVRWSGDGRRIYFSWKRAADPHDRPLDTYVVNRDGTGLRKLTEDEAKIAPPANGNSTRDRSLTVYARDGDIFLYDSANDGTRRITSTEDVESNPRFLPDGRRVAFTRGGNLYTTSLEDGALAEMTDIRAEHDAGGAPAIGEERKKGTASQEYIRKQERELIGVVDERARRREADEARRKRERPGKTFRLGARQSVVSLQLSPDAKFVLALISERGEGAKKTMVPNFVTE
ncbi:MAG: TolB family protein, partial [Bryobacteraceae bacterium]